MSAIPKTMIFINSINERIALTEYLYIKLSNNLKDKVEYMIQYFYSNLSDKLRKLFVKDYLWGNIHI